MSALKCLNGPDGCVGAVEYRWPGYGERQWPRCEKHGDARVRAEEESTARNGNPDSACPPAGFDPYACGERWDEE